MTIPDPLDLKARFFQIVSDQIRDEEPPETKEAYNRLIAAGHSHEQTMTLLACAVGNEVFKLVKNNEDYNEERYVQALKALPDLEDA